MTFSLKIALLGLLSLSAAFTLPACQSNKACRAEACAETCKETPVAVKDLPPAVVATVNREVPGGRIVEAEMCEKQGRTCYCVEVQAEGKTWELCVMGDGSLKKKELEG